MCVTWLGAMPFISKRLTKKHAVLVHGLGAVGGDAPVRGQFGLFAAIERGRVPSTVFVLPTSRLAA